MNRPQSISAALVNSRWGRATLHVVCLVRGGPRRWHLRGIVRELFRLRRAHSGRADRPLCALLLCALLGGGIPVFAFAGSPALTLLPIARVDGGGIYLHQVAPTSLSIPVPQTIRLANAPSFGQAASLSREQIGELLKSLAPEFASTNWSGAAQVRVARPSRPVAESISLKVEALADGLPGQTVRVRNPKTKREFYAKVLEEQIVVINL